MFQLPLENENDLLQRLAGDDAIAFEILFSHYEESVKIFLLRYVKVPAIVEDLSQEVFSKIWESRAQMPEIKSFRAYLFTIARNHTLNFLHRASRVDAAMALIIHHLPKRVNAADDDLLNQEYNNWLQAILAGMSPQMRQVFQLVRQENKTYDEVAELTGISRNTVKKHMVRSMKLIKGKLGDELGVIIVYLVVPVPQLFIFWSLN